MKTKGKGFWTKLAITFACVFTLGLGAISVDTSTPTPVAAASGHEHTTEWKEWTETDSLPTTSGKYYLSANLGSLAAQTIEAENDVILCLNGKTVDLGGNKQIDVYGNFTVCDCGTGGKITAYNNSCIAVYGDAVLTVEGGTIENTNKTSGQAIKVDGSDSKGGKAVISGGTVKGANGVMVTGVAESLTMSGGEIIGTYSNGKGISNYSVVTMTGGSVSGGKYGVYNDYSIANQSAGKLSVTGGSISGGQGIHNRHHDTYTCIASVGGDAKVTGTDGEGIYNDAKTSVSGTTTIKGTTRGIHNYRELYLSGTPTITGAVGVEVGYSAAVYARAEGDETNVYAGAAVTVTFEYLSRNDVVIYDVTETNKDSFTLVKPCHTMGLGEGNNANNLIVVSTSEHTYSSDCDTVCNACNMIRTAPENHAFDSDCTTADTCKNCEQVASADATHTFDNDCTTADTCKNCEQVASANATHTFDNDCTTADTCKNCEQVASANATHTFDSNCTTADKCANCEQVASANATHTFDNDCTTADKCANCEQVATANEAHTFDEEGVCENCGFTLEPVPMFTVTVQDGGIDGVEGNTTEIEMGSDNTVTVRANADPEGKRFKGWEIDGVLVSAEKVYTFAPTANTVIKAVYEDVEEEENGDNKGLVLGLSLGGVALVAVGIGVYLFIRKKEK